MTEKVVDHTHSPYRYTPKDLIMQFSSGIFFLAVYYNVVINFIANIY